MEESDVVIRAAGSEDEGSGLFSGSERNSGPR